MKNLAVILVLWIGLGMETVRAQESRIVDLEGNGVAGVEITVVSKCLSVNGGEFTSTTSTFSDAAGGFNWPKAIAGLSIRPIDISVVANSCPNTLSHSYTLKKQGYDFVRSDFLYRPGDAQHFLSYDDRLPVIQATGLPLWVNVSATHFDNVNLTQRKVIAAGMLMAGFGVGLSNVTASAPAPLPTEFAGRKVLVKDATGVERAAQILFVSPGQINYVLPEELADGAVQIRLVDQNNNLIRIGLAEVRKYSPGIFTANFDGNGVPAGLVVCVKPGDVQSYEPIARFDPAKGKYVPIELDLGPPDEFLVLALFGTGWRQVASLGVEFSRHSSPLGPDILVRLTAEYVGKQPTFAGLDQINVRLPRELIGSGELSVRLDPRDSSYLFFGNGNTVTLSFK